MRAKALICLFLTALLATALLLKTPSGAQALPRGFFGIVPQTALGKEDVSRMRSGGVETIRMLLPWGSIDPTPRGEYDWGSTDQMVALAAEQRLEVLPFLISTPGWLS